MTTGLDETLLIQARDLLDQCSELLQRPGGPEQIRSKALECHAKMLELGELQRSEAIEYALTGAQLLAALQGHPCSDPDWVAVHEEQCCRYGAAWVHAAFKESETAQTIAWSKQALVMLDRLQQLLNPKPTWIELLSKELRDRLKQLSSPERFAGAQNSLTIALVGNCQAFPLLCGLRNSLPEASINFCPSVHLATSADVARLHQSLPTADVLVTHRVQPGYRNNIGLDTSTLKSLIPQSARCLVLPNLHYEGQLPWCGYGQDPDGRLAALEADSPLGPYQDFLAMAAAGLELDAKDLLNQPCPDGVAALLQIAHQSSLAELQSREAQCTIQLSDWIAEHHRHERIGHTINHPTQASLHELLRLLLGKLDPEHQLGPDPFDSQDHLGSLSLPIHPWVQQAFNLGSWANGCGQREGIPITIHTQLAESIAFYRRHPWIAAANADHPKLIFAKQCLGLLQKASPQVGSQADQANNTASDSSLSCSVVIQFFEDFDFIEPVLRQLAWVDEIIVNDGPFTFAVELLTPIVGRDLKLPSERTQEICQRLSLELSVPIHYHYNTFEDERSKRIYGYEQATGFVVMSVDADEFLLIKPEQARAFARSEALAASFNCYNFTFFNLLLTGPTGTPISSPKPFAFKRAAISAEDHINYLWLVGVNQVEAPAQHFLSGTLCDGIHLTTVRSDYGASIKFSFYTCLYFKLAGRALEGVFAEALNFFRKSDYPIAIRTEVLARAIPDAIGFPANQVLLRPSPRDVPLAILETEAKLSRTFNHNKVQRHIGGSLLPSIPAYLVCKPSEQLTVALSVAGNVRLRVFRVQLEGEPFTLSDAISEHNWFAEPLRGESVTIMEPEAQRMDNNPIGFLLELTLWIAPEVKERFSAASLAPTFNLAMG